MQIFIIKSGFIFIQTIVQHDLYTFACACRNHLSKHLFTSDWVTSKTWFLNASTESAGEENRWPRKRWHCVPNQSCTTDELFDVLNGQKGAGLSRWLRACIVMVNNDLCSRLCFSNVSEYVRQTNCGLPLRVDSPTMLKWNSRHMTSFAEETVHHLLRSVSFTNNIRWIWLCTVVCNAKFLEINLQVGIGWTDLSET